MPLATIAKQGRDAIYEVVSKGRFEQAMPPWGSGVDVLAGVLTEEEIHRIIDYITTELFPSGRSGASTVGSSR